MGKPGVGDAAPDFDLPGTGGRRHCLGDYRGRPVVLAFYPGDDTPVCTMQLNAYTADIEEFQGVGAQLLAISPQDVESHERFSCKHNFAFPLLADVDKEVGRAYGVVGPLGFYRRSVFVIDGDGVIRYAHRSLTGASYRKSDELVQAVEAASDPTIHP